MFAHLELASSPIMLPIPLLIQIQVGEEKNAEVQGYHRLELHY
jgi:hypothetical protein